MMNFVLNKVLHSTNISMLVKAKACFLREVDTLHIRTVYLAIKHQTSLASNAHSTSSSRTLSSKHRSWENKNIKLANYLELNFTSPQ